MSISSLLNIGTRAMTASYAPLTRHRQQHRQRQHAGLLAPDGAARDLVQPADRLGLLRQGRRRRDRDARAQRLPDPRGRDRGLDGRRRRRAHHAAAAAREACSRPARTASATRRSRPSTPSSTSPTTRRTRRRGRSALARVGDDGERTSAAPASQLDALQAGVADQDLRTSVASVNSLTTQIADLNARSPAPRAAASRRTACSTSATRRSTDLSQLVQVTTVAAADGTRRRLPRRRPDSSCSAPRRRRSSPCRRLRPVEGADRHQRTAATTTRLPRRLHRRRLGRAACCASRTTTFADARDLLGQMAAAIAGALNSQQALGLDLGHAGAAGAPLLVDRRRDVAAVVEQRDGRRRAGRLVRERQRHARLERQRSASSIRKAAAAERLRARRRSDAAGRAVQADAAVRRQRADGRAAARRRRLPDRRRRARAGRARPLPAAAGVAGGAHGMARALDDPNGIAAASPVHGDARRRQHRHRDGRLARRRVSPSINPNLTATITFTDDSRRLQLQPGRYDRRVADRHRHRHWAAGQPIALNGCAARTCNGVPNERRLAERRQDRVSGRQQRQRERHGGAARRRRIVGRDVPAAASPPAQNVTDAYASALANVGVRVQSAKTAADAVGARSPPTRRPPSPNKSGVNLDEEAARLIQYQQSYQAAAKMLQVAQIRLRQPAAIGSVDHASDTDSPAMRIATANAYDTGIDTCMQRQTRPLQPAGADDDRQARQPGERRPGRRRARRARARRVAGARSRQPARRRREQDRDDADRELARRRRRPAAAARASCWCRPATRATATPSAQSIADAAAVDPRPAARRSPTRATAPAAICSAARARRRSRSSTRPAACSTPPRAGQTLDRQRRPTCR